MHRSQSESRRSFLRRAVLTAACTGLVPSAWAQRQRTSTPIFYPLHAIQAGYEGTATVYAEIARGGYAEVARIEKTSGQTILDQAAVGAVSLWVFKENLPKKKQKVLIPLKFKLTDETRRDLPQLDGDGKYSLRMAKAFYPFRADERNLTGTCRVLVELSSDGFAENASLETPTKSDVLNHCSILFSLISSFGPNSTTLPSSPRHAITTWDFKIK